MSLMVAVGTWRGKALGPPATYERACTLTGAGIWYVQRVQVPDVSVCEIIYIYMCVYITGAGISVT